MNGAAARSSAVSAQAGNSQEPLTPSQADTSANRALLKRYCISCHNERLKTAGLLLDKADPDQPAASAGVWEKVIKKLGSGAMPPPGLPRPDPSASQAFVSSLVAVLDAAALRNPNPGRPAAHRLNRVEYGNAIRDLLHLEIDSRALLPPDDEDHGFDNIANILSVSPTLLERYQAAAQKVSQLAVGDPAIRPVFETYNVPERLVQDDRTSDDQPFGSRGGITFTHYFPLDGEYVVRLKLRRTLYSYIRGIGLPHQLDVRVDRQRVKVFTVGGEHKESD